MLKFFDRLKGPDVANFAEGLATQIQKRYPPELDNTPSKRPSVNRLTRIIEDACIKASEFGTQKQLGWLGKARLGNHFRWKLTEAGYRKEFVDFATEAVIVHISRGPSGSPNKEGQ
jgi:hypothetical protein